MLHANAPFSPLGPLLDSDVAKIHELLLQLIRDENAAEAAGSL